MSIWGAGTNDFANLAGDNENYEVFQDIQVDGNIYLYPYDTSDIGFNAPIITNKPDVNTGDNNIILNLNGFNDNIVFSLGTGQDTYSPFLKFNPNGIDFNSGLTAYNLNWDELSFLDGVTSPIQNQINNIATGTGYWGGFWSTTTQTNPTINTINLVTYNANDPSNNQISYSNNSRINFTNKGTYLILASFQLSKSSGSTEEAIYFFLRKNGTDVSASGYKEFVKTTPKILTATWIIDASANDYVEIAWWSSDIHARLEFISAGTGTPVYPSSPSALVQVSAVSRIAGSGGSYTNPVLNYMTLTDVAGSTNINIFSTTISFGSSTAPAGAYSVCRGNFLLNRTGADLSITNGRIRSNGAGYTNELRNLTCAGTVSLYDTTSTYRFTASGINNLTGICQLGTYGNNDITCFSNFVKRINDDYAIYLKTGDLKLEAGNLYPNNIFWDASNNWNGSIFKTNNIICNQTLTTNDFSVTGNATICDNVNDVIILNGKIAYMTASGALQYTSINALGSIRSDSDIIAPKLQAGTAPNAVTISWLNSTFNNIQTTGQNYFYGDFFVIDNASCYINMKGNIVLGSSNSNTIGALGNFLNRGDGYAIYTSTGGIRSAGDITTPNDLWCNCYSIGGINYGFYKLIDFINERDQVCYDRGTEGVNKANDAYNLAAAAQATATATAAALAAEALIVTGLAADVGTLNATVAAQGATIGSLSTRTTALEDKTLNMLPASSGYASHFLNRIQIYQSSDPINPVIDLDPYGLSTIGNGVKTNQIRHTNATTPIDIPIGINTGDITADEIGCNKITNSGNTQTGSLNTGSITATTGTHSIDGSSISLGSYLTPVYINGLLYIPFNPISFLSQW